MTSTLIDCAPTPTMVADPAPALPPLPPVDVPPAPPDADAAPADPAPLPESPPATPDPASADDTSLPPPDDVPPAREPCPATTLVAAWDGNTSAATSSPMTKPMTTWNAPNGRRTRSCRGVVVTTGLGTDASVPSSPQLRRRAGPRSRPAPRPNAR